ncbi:MAG: SGNH/GDSL hydrolase family protein [Thermoguttaceae bacterium]
MSMHRPDSTPRREFIKNAARVAAASALAGMTVPHIHAAGDNAAGEPVGAWRFSREKVRPFWLSDTMDGESVLFIQDRADSRPRASLLFPPTRILSVCNPSGNVTYQAGRDYVCKPGTNEIVLPPGSAISFKTPRDLRRPARSQPYVLTHRDGNGEILFGGGHEYHDMQTVVSYEHAPGAWAGLVPSFAGDRLPRTIRRLREKQPLTIALLGDSISTGCNASGWAKVAPFQPPFQDLLVLNLEAVYGARVTLKNYAVGGTDTAWGLANIGKVVQAQPDLVLLAFGMNDAGGRSAADYQANLRAMIDAVSKAKPDTEFILVATMLGNKDWTVLRQELFPRYRDALAKLCRPGIVMADLTTLWAELLKHKPYWDLTGNGVNHPNDFGHRIYAQALSALLIQEP